MSTADSRLNFMYCRFHILYKNPKCNILKVNFTFMRDYSILTCCILKNLFIQSDWSWEY